VHGVRLNAHTQTSTHTHIHTRTHTHTHTHTHIPDCGSQARGVRLTAYSPPLHPDLVWRPGVTSSGFGVISKGCGVMRNGLHTHSHSVLISFRVLVNGSRNI
jgi:hypothetical protein